MKDFTEKADKRKDYVDDYVKPIIGALVGAAIGIGYLRITEEFPRIFHETVPGQYVFYGISIAAFGAFLGGTYECMLRQEDKNESGRLNKLEKEVK